MSTHEDLLSACVKVLEQNDRGDHTQPASGLYPHQWLWDSCFIAIGLRHVDVSRAQKEINSLFRGQWANGMLPHIIFNPSKSYKLDRDMWRSWVSPYSPDTHSTSGITQPPVIAQAIWLVGEKLSKVERIKWFKQLLPNLIKHHQWLYEERDPHAEGLTLQIHPYETGLDSTPPWLLQLHEHSKPWWIASIEWARLDSVVNVFRRDTRHAPPGQRMTNIDALLYWDVIRRFRRKQWDISRILHRSLFCIEDVSFNSMLIRNNKLLCKIANEARIKLPEDLLTSMKKSEKALGQLWDEGTGQYYSRDFITHELLPEQTIAGLTPLYAGGIPKEHSKRLVELLTDHRKYWLNHPVPSVPMNSKYFSAERYWQGPSWVNTNWLLIDGLKRNGSKDIAEELTLKTVDMVARAGASEYFSPIDGRGLGASNFSWTAALIIDLLSD